MARPRKPTAVLELSGAFEHDPQRKRADPEPAGPVGEPPRWLSPIAAQCWREMVADAPARVLTSADRPVLAVAARIYAKVQQDEPTPVQELTLLLRCLAELGATPASRSKVTQRPEEKSTASPWDRLAAMPQPGASQAPAN